MNRATPKRQAQLRQYRKRVHRFLEVNTICFRCHYHVPERWRENHHFFGRRGELLNWVPGFRCACRECHAYIESHRKEAIEKGWRADERIFNRPSIVIPQWAQTQP